MKRILACVVLVVVAVMFSFNGIAVASKAKTTMVQGDLEKVDGKYQIKSREGTFLIKGQDFSDLVGEEVQATGTMESGPSGDVLEVKAIKKLVTKSKKK